jgi:tripartite-type tricarboxylate transporter receptor subunit TctC
MDFSLARIGRRAVFALALMAAGFVHAQAWPTRPVKLIVPVPPGQSTDILARVLADQLARALGQPFIVENKPGAGLTIGTDFVAKAPSDGYTLLMSSSGSLAMAPAIYTRIAYDPVRDFEPITNIALVIQTLVTAPNSGIKDTKDFVAKAKAGKLNYASSGSGTTSHLAMELFADQAGFKATHIPFKGTTEAQMQVIGGQIEVQFDAPGVASQIKAGKLKAIGVGSSQRTPLLPDVPTLAEQGYKGFEAVGWIGMSAPAGTPAPILDKLNAEVRKALDLPDVREKLNSLSFTKVGDTREQFGAFIKSEIAKWGRIAKQSGAKAD